MTPIPPRDAAPPPRSMDILVIGASGLLGTSVVAQLESRGHRILAHGREAGPAIPRDFAEPGAADRALEATPCDVVLNLAAKADVDACERDPATARRLNAAMPGELARACRSRGLPMVHLSTDMVYDGPGPHPEDRVHPLNVYATTKLEGDLAVAGYGGCALRTNFFGPSLHPTRRSFTDWLFDGFRERRELPLLRDVLFSPLSMATLADLLELVLLRPPAGAVLNLGSRGGKTKRDFALAFAEACGIRDPLERPVALAELRLAAARPTDMRMDVAAFESRFGIALPDLDAEIRQAAQAHLRHAG